MAPADPPQRCRVDQLSDGLLNRRKHPPHSRVKQQRLVVFDEEMIELHVELGMKNGDAIQIRRDFVDFRHGTTS
jgi:hypothetical protein